MKVYILIDDVEEYEESLKILGAFESKEKAEESLPLCTEDFRFRTIAIQEWEGTRCVHEWEYIYVHAPGFPAGINMQWRQVREHEGKMKWTNGIGEGADQ